MQKDSGAASSAVLSPQAVSRECSAVQGIAGQGRAGQGRAGQARTRGEAKRQPSVMVVVVHRRRRPLWPLSARRRSKC
jgi:hypothetical protein